MSIPALVLDSIHKRFGDFVALDNISLAFEEGAFVSFLGPSGCGKTTLLRIIAGLEQQSQGKVWQRGVDVSLRPPGQRDFGIVFQSYALFPNLTVARNVGFGLENAPRAIRLSAGDRARKVADLLDLVGLRDQAAKYPGQLSGGQQQRVGLARALAGQPSLLLLDEPLSALDAKVRAHLRTEIKSLQRRLGLTTIMVTHDQEEALSMADIVVVMNQGRVEQVGPPAAIYGHPVNAFVAGFVGTINVLAGHRLPSGALRLGPPNGAGGEGVSVCLRPEDVLCLPVEGGAPDPDDPFHDGHVRETEFLGPVTRAHVQVPALGAAPLIADLPARQAGQLDLAPGRPVRLVFPRAQLRSFPAEAFPPSLGGGEKGA